MAKPLITDELWEVIEPLLPPERDKPRGGRRHLPNRAVLRGILFVLSTGLPWEYLSPEMGCGSGMTCWRRLKEWHDLGVWKKLHQVLLDRFGEADRIDWSHAALDSSRGEIKRLYFALGDSNVGSTSKSAAALFH